MAARTTELSAQELYQKKGAVLPAQLYQPDASRALRFPSRWPCSRRKTCCPSMWRRFPTRPFTSRLSRLCITAFPTGARCFRACWAINAKSPKWISVIVCFLQRVGFFTIFLSTFLAGGNTGVAHGAVLCLVCHLLGQRRHVEPAVRADGGHFHPPQRGHVLRRLQHGGLFGRRGGLACSSRAAWRPFRISCSASARCFCWGLFRRWWPRWW